MPAVMDKGSVWIENDPGYGEGDAVESLLRAVMGPLEFCFGPEVGAFPDPREVCTIDAPMPEGAYRLRLFEDRYAARRQALPALVFERREHTLRADHPLPGAGPDGEEVVPLREFALTFNGEDLGAFEGQRFGREHPVAQALALRLITEHRPPSWRLPTYVRPVVETWEVAAAVAAIGPSFLDGLGSLGGWPQPVTHVNGRSGARWLHLAAHPHRPCRWERFVYPRGRWERVSEVVAPASVPKEWTLGDQAPSLPLASLALTGVLGLAALASKGAFGRHAPAARRIAP